MTTPGSSRNPRIPTWRDALRNRPIFAALRRLAAINASDLREHLATELRDLMPWDEKTRRAWVGFLTVDFPPPDAPPFWQHVATVEKLERRAREADAGFIMRERLRHAQSTGDLDADTARLWQGTAARLFAARPLLRFDGRRHLASLSRGRRTVWEKGHARCPLAAQRSARERDQVCGLTTLVHADGTCEPWVQEAIQRMQLQQLSTDRIERGRATTILKAGGKALWEVGRGPTARLTAQERKDRKAVSTRATKRVARAVAATDREIPRLNPDHFTRESVARRLLAARLAEHAEDEVDATKRALKRRLRGRRQT